MLKKQLLLLIFLFSFSALWADVLDDDKYNLAIKLYKSENYQKAQDLLFELVEDDYTNIFIYFLLGRTGRHLGQYDVAVTNFENYLKSYVFISEKDRIATKINLAYEYAKGPSSNKGHSSDKEDLLRKAKKIVEELKSNSQYKTEYPKLWKDILYCASTVFNKNAHYWIEKDVDIKQPKKYYIEIQKTLEEAIKLRSDNIPAAGNLAYVYFRIMEFNLKSKNKEDFNNYYKLVKNLIEERNFFQYQDTVEDYLSKLEQEAKDTFKR